MCNDERMKKAQGQEKDMQLKKEHAPLAAAVPALSSPLLPMFKPKLSAKSAHAVGNYALQIDFNDGHTAGIFSFDYLRTICPCQECAREYRSNLTSKSEFRIRRLGGNSSATRLSSCADLALHPRVLFCFSPLRRI